VDNNNRLTLAGFIGQRPAVIAMLLKNGRADIILAKLLLDFLLALRAQLAVQNLASPLTDAMGDIVPGDVISFAVVGDVPNDDMSVGGAGVVLDPPPPVQPRLQIAFDLFHQLAGKRLGSPSLAPSSGATMIRNWCGSSAPRSSKSRLSGTSKPQRLSMPGSKKSGVPPISSF
jgi:hypothetical protein